MCSVGRLNPFWRSPWLAIPETSDPSQIGQVITAMSGRVMLQLRCVEPRGYAVTGPVPSLRKSRGTKDSTGGFVLVDPRDLRIHTNRTHHSCHVRSHYTAARVKDRKDVAATGPLVSLRQSRGVVKCTGGEVQRYKYSIAHFSNISICIFISISRLDFYLSNHVSFDEPLLSGCRCGRPRQCCCHSTGR